MHTTDMQYIPLIVGLAGASLYGDNNPHSSTSIWSNLLVSVNMVEQNYVFILIYRASLIYTKDLAVYYVSSIIINLWRTCTAGLQ